VFKIQLLPGPVADAQKEQQMFTRIKHKRHLKVKTFLPWMHKVPNLADKAEHHIWQNTAIKVVSK